VVTNLALLLPWKKKKNYHRLVPIEKGEGVQSVMKEVDIMRTINSDFVIKAYDTFVHDEHLWVKTAPTNPPPILTVLAHTHTHTHTHQIVLEYCAAGSVADYIRLCNHPLEEKYIASICR